MGIVYLAQDTRLNCPVTIKFPPCIITGNQENRLQLIRKALKIYPEDAGVQFNRACFMARTGKKEAALNLLREYFGKGSGNRDRVMNDPDFESLRDNLRFQALLVNIPG